MKGEKPFEEQLIDKYPNIYKGENCHICRADLRYMHKIHRVDFEWYCDSCFEERETDKNEY